MPLKKLAVAACAATVIVGAGAQPAAATAARPGASAATSAPVRTTGTAQLARQIQSAKVPRGVTIWYPGKATDFVPGMWALKRRGNTFLLASNADGLQCMSGTIKGSKIKYRYSDQDFEFPASTGKGTGRMKMSGRNLLVRGSHFPRPSSYVKAIPGASAHKAWVNFTQGRRALADCADAL